MRVLIVAEDPAERRRAGSLLRAREGVELLEADSAADAKQAMVDLDIDVVVVDGDLAPQGGYSFLYEARAEAELHGTTVPRSVVLTERPQDQWLAGWARADVTLPLPADPFAVARAVDGLVAPGV